MEKEVYWSRFARDFEARNIYVVGSRDFAAVKEQVASEKDLGRVLELGCGNGTYSEILAREADHVTATDFSDEMLEIATARAEGSGITVEKQNCLDLSYQKPCFDTVVMINLLHIIPTPELALKEARRVLNENGRIVVLSFTTDGMAFWAKLTMFYRYLKTYGKPPETSRHLTMSSTRSLLSGAGFSVEQACLVGERSKAVWAVARAV